MPISWYFISSILFKKYTHKKNVCKYSRNLLLISNLLYNQEANSMSVYYFLFF